MTAAIPPVQRHSFQLVQPEVAAAQQRPGNTVITATPMYESGAEADGRGGVKDMPRPVGGEADERSGGGQGGRGSYPSRRAIRPSRVVQGLVGAPPSTSLFLA